MVIFNKLTDLIQPDPLSTDKQYFQNRTEI